MHEAYYVYIMGTGIRSAACKAKWSLSVLSASTEVSSTLIAGDTTM